jgi:hypothetical protein
MSLLGKILALLNLFGVAAVVFLAIQDYTKRQSWGYKLQLHELARDGLPLDPTEDRSDSVRYVDLIGEETVKSMFSNAGGWQAPVYDPNGKRVGPTQIQEVDVQKAHLDSKLNAEKGDRAKTYLLSRILLPLADLHIEREQLLACRSLLADDAKEKAFKKRYVDAFAEARRRMNLAVAPGDLPKSFEEHFRSSVRGQGGVPSEAFTSLVIRQLPPDDKKAAANIEEAYKNAFAAQLKQFEARYKEHFDAAQKGPLPATVAKQWDDKDKQEAETKKLDQQELTDKRRAREMQKAAVAHLLFGLCMFLTEDAIESGQAAQDAALVKGLPRDGAAYAMRLPDTRTYQTWVKRMLVVCGLKNGLDAISRRAVVLRKLDDYLISTIAEERHYFLADHAALVEEIRQRLLLVRNELDLKTENERRLASQEELVKKRQTDVNKHKEELKQSRLETEKKMQELRELSQKLLDERVADRDLIRQTIESEKLIRELENKIRTLEENR